MLGVRTFEGPIPFRSRWGNGWTRILFRLLTGLAIRDTQSGLRGIPSDMLDRMLALRGDRYEYEMAMLADARSHEQKPLQIPIETIYIEENATSHFNPILDTIRVYRSLFQFCLSSVLSFLLDNAVFAAVVWYFAGKATPRREDVLIALVAARLASSNFNFFYNRFVVFYRRRKLTRMRVQRGVRNYFTYWALVLALAAASYALTTLCAALFDVRGVAITIVKIVVETFLFLASYFIQKRFIFK